MKKILFLFLIVVLGACVDNTVKIPKDILPPEKMVEVFVDVHLLEGARTGDRIFGGDTFTIQSYYLKLYEDHGIDSTIYQNSFNWYSEHPSELTKIYEETIEQLTILEAEKKTELSKNKKADMPVEMEKKIKDKAERRKL